MKPLKQRLCYVDPIYFITHNLQDHALNKTSAYFDIFPEDIQEDYTPMVSDSASEFSEYVATGIYDDILYFDVMKIPEQTKYAMIITSDIYVTDQLHHMYIGLFFDRDKEDNFCGALNINVDDNDDTQLLDELLYFDTFEELRAIYTHFIKKTVYTELRDQINEYK